jgi:hypothetical protein
VIELGLLRLGKAPARPAADPACPRSIVRESFASAWLMSMIASCRERDRSVCPVSRRSFGRIVPSVATTESRRAIRRNVENEIASFPAFKPEKLAISNALVLGKSTPAQGLGRFSRPTQP